jgi:hypothetical protein
MIGRGRAQRLAPLSTREYLHTEAIGVARREGVQRVFPLPSTHRHCEERSDAAISVTS